MSCVCFRVLFWLLVAGCLPVLRFQSWFIGCSFWCLVFVGAGFVGVGVLAGLICAVNSVVF